MANMQPLGRLGLPEHIGETVAFLANDELAGYTTGVDIAVDGGSLLGGMGKQQGNQQRGGGQGK